VIHATVIHATAVRRTSHSNPTPITNANTTGDINPVRNRPNEILIMKLRKNRMWIINGE
jgi:hypothetical protein